MKQFRKILGAAAIAAALAGCQRSPEILVCGTYTGDGSHGVYSLQFDSESGTLTVIDSVAAVNPSYVIISDDGKHVYAVSENGNESGVYSIDFDSETGRFGQAHFEPQVGADPCYIAQVGDKVITADYSGGSVSFFDIKGETLVPAGLSDSFQGSGPDARRQASAHVHSTVLSPDGLNVYVADLGSDRLYCYDVITDELLHAARVDLAPGFGPRISAVSPNGKYVYVLGELSGEIAVFSRQGHSLRQLQTVVCDSLNVRAAGDIHTSRDGRFVYGSTRREGDGIRTFAVGKDGSLTDCGFTPTGKHPRQFYLTADDGFVLVACRDADAVEVYRRDATTGQLTATGQRVRLRKPVCVSGR